MLNFQSPQPLSRNENIEGPRPFNFQSLGKLPRVCVVQRDKSYQGRFPVPNFLVSRRAAFENYAPPFAIPDKNEGYRGEKLAISYEGNLQRDPKDDSPLNPIGRTGLKGKGKLWNFGPNQAADAVLLTRKKDGWYGLFIQRADGSWAFPGGFLNQGEQPEVAMLRELFEEAVVEDSGLLQKLQQQSRCIYQGYADDPRNTDNAWIETSAFLVVLDETESEHLRLSSRDDAQAVAWKRLEGDWIHSLYGGHPELAQIALLEASKGLARQDSPLLPSFSTLLKKGLKRIGIFGGSFDPIHSGHREVAQAALLASGLDAVVFIPAAQNPMKEKVPMFSASERLEYIAEAISTTHQFYVSSLELRKPEGPSYTVDTLQRIKREAPDLEISFILGADTLPSLHQWEHIKECFKLADFIPVKRGTFCREEILSLANTLGSTFAKRLYRNFVDVETSAISSTAIRERLEGNPHAKPS